MYERGCYSSFSTLSLEKRRMARSHENWMKAIEKYPCPELNTAWSPDGGWRRAYELLESQLRTVLFGLGILFMNKNLLPQHPFHCL